MKGIGGGRLRIHYVNILKLFTVQEIENHFGDPKMSLLLQNKKHRDVCVCLLLIRRLSISVVHVTSYPQHFFCAGDGHSGISP